MKFIAKDEKEFEEMIKLSKYLHDIYFRNYTGFNWRFWQWFWTGSIFNYEYICLDLEGYSLLNSITHLYRIKHAHKEGKYGIAESEELKKIFYVEGSDV